MPPPGRRDLSIAPLRLCPHCAPDDTRSHTRLSMTRPRRMRPRRIERTQLSRRRRQRLPCKTSTHPTGHALRQAHATTRPPSHLAAVPPGAAYECKCLHALLGDRGASTVVAARRPCATYVRPYAPNRPTRTHTDATPNIGRAAPRQAIAAHAQRHPRAGEPPSRASSIPTQPRHTGSVEPGGSKNILIRRITRRGPRQMGAQPPMYPTPP